MTRGISLLDVKLGLRMLVKYPGLSLVSVTGMAVAIAMGAGAFAAMNTMVNLPLDGGHRIVSIQNQRADRAGEADRHALHDFEAWRGGLKSVRVLGAFRTESRNLAVAGRSTEVVRVAEMTASGFRVAGVAPALGRPLVDDDERAAAPPVLVMAQEEWRGRFGGDPAILGRTVRLGGTEHTVVGVMPAGFRFPINHRYWTPLRLDAARFERGGGPAIDVFGRLAEGATLRQAQAELSAIGARTAAAHPATHQHLRPRVLPYTHPFVGIDSPATALAIRAVQLLVSMLVVVVSVNVAILVYARTAARMSEIAVRTALGASRRRVVAQLFVEALVLSVVAAAIGLALAAAGFELANEAFAKGAEELPFWIRFGLTPGVVAYAGGLAVLAGAIAGILPALKATGQDVQKRLQQFSSHGSRMQLGRTWTALIVTQVALAVAVLPFALNFAASSVSHGTGGPGYPAEEFVRARLSLDGGDSARFADRAGELVRRVREEPGVTGVTYASSYPGSEPFAGIETESGAGTKASWVQLNRIDPELFRVFEVPVLAGRGFTAADGRAGSAAVIVNRVLAEKLGGNAVGRRIRHRGEGTDSARAGRWFEVVGVVPDFPAPSFNLGPTSKLYHPAAVDELPSIALALRTGGSTAVAARRLREVAEAVDPALRVEGVQTVADAQRLDRQSVLYGGLATIAVTLSVLLLSAAGIYAMMSFTVVRRRREIGIRAALGADPRHVLRSVFARASAQIGAGVLVGLVLSAAVDLAAGGALVTGSDFVLWPLVALLMSAVGIAAALGPARQGLRIEPSEALRDDG